MRLKKIEITGFKSFADKTVLNFHPGITGIVGPNGCGKSNISDSFRWVLGEQSAKSMRGTKMHDVIFAGTDKRKPLNFAEVTITLTDVAGLLPTEYEEVSVTRRIHRSGESEYLLNRRPVRLKDVYDMFLDTGIGKNAFSIFEQGKIDQVINLNSLERRYIFEEAAGILRFLQRKKEALRRLEQTEQNIDRVKDIHREVEKQIIVLEEQAQKARIYKENKSQLETLELGLFVAKWENFAKRQAAIGEKEREKKQRLEECGRALQEIDAARHDAAVRHHQVQKELQDKKEKVFQTRSQKEIKAKQRETGEERLQEMVVKEAQWRRELEQMIERRKLRQTEAQKARELQAQVERQLTGMEGDRQARKEKLRTLEMAVQGIRDRQHAMQKTLMALLQEENRIESELKQTTIRMEHLQDRKVRSMQQQETLAQQKMEASQALTGKNGAIAALMGSLESLKAKHAGYDSAIKEKSDKIQSTQEQLDAVYRLRAENKARQSVLLRLRDEMEGFSSGTKRLLAEAVSLESPLYGKIRGLYESIAPENGTEMALSVVMKRYMQTLVTETKDDFAQVLRFASDEGLKDFSLICLEALVKQPPALPLEGAAKLCASFSGKPLEEHFLHDLYRVKDTLEALHHFGRYPEAEFWTEDNIFVDRRQVAFFASEGEQNVFLREAELKELSQVLKEAEERKEALEVELNCLVEDRKRLQAEKAEHDLQIRRQEMAVVEERYAADRLKGDLEKAEGELEREKGEAQDLEEAIGSLKQIIGDLNHKHAEAKAKVEKTQDEVRQQHAALEDNMAELQLQQEEMEEKEGSYQHAIEEKRKITHQLNLFEVKDLESLQQEQRLEEEIHSIREKHANLRLSLVEFEEQFKAVEESLAKELKRCESLGQIVEERRQEILKVEEKQEAMRKAIREEEAEMHGLGIQAAQVESARSALEGELFERFHLTVSEAKGKGIVLEHSLEKAERDIRSLRRAMEDAGDINMTSIEEFDRHKERYAFLNQQIDDLTASKQELVEIITQLDGESRKIFQQTFETIRENFKKNFEILFTGGAADLCFTESGDILEAGIDIIAKPPGKQMRSIQLLSGGEKCLTAVALLFAIFEVKPAPFCILDEIDAPLDDTNVERFLNVVKQFTDRCQFIIITHNKGSMSICDRLFGVSMQEKGVSKMLQIEFAKEVEPQPVLV